MNPKISERKVVAITGAYKGLGAALCNLFAEKGYSIVLGGRSKVALKAFAEKIKSLTDVVDIVFDVRKKSECENFVRAAIKKFGRLDIIINNAAIWRMTKMEDVTEKDVRDIFETNVFGPIWCAQAAVREMKKRGSGIIVNIGSTAAVDYKTSHIAYGASKAAVIGFTGCLRTELEGTGIRAMVFSPGGMKTELFRTHPERMKDYFMEPSFVAEQIVNHIENTSEEWHVVLRRP